MILLALALLLAPSPDWRAAASDADPVAAARAWYQVGTEAERAGQLEAAVDAYRRSLAGDPGGRFAARAHARANALAARPPIDRAVLDRFDRVRRDYRALGRAEATARVTAQLAEARDPRTVAQLRLWLGEEAAAAADLATARAHAFAAADTPGVPPGAVRRAFELALRAAGPADWDAVEAHLRAFADRWPERAAAVDVARLADEVSDLRQRRRAAALAWAALAALAALLLWSRAWRALTPATLRRWRPWRGLLYLTWAFGGAALLADRFEGGFGLVIGATGLALVPVHLAAGALGQTRRAPRPLVFVVVLGASLGTAFLVLARLGQTAIMGM